MTVPRTVLAYEYAVIRRPITLVEHVLVGRLDADNPRRLAVERTLGQVDALAGRWLDNAALTARGQRSQAHADAATKAQALTLKARQTKAKADATLKRDTKAADKQRVTAIHEHQAEVAEATQKAAGRKADAAKQARARVAAEKSAIAQQTQAKVKAAQTRQKAKTTAADSRLKVATAAPKAELAAARQASEAAAAQRADAERLAQLAETEKQSRQNS